ncbi:MAG: hypothetical protein ACR2KP_19305, partial [Egibacteraceae bacterium]
DAELTHKFHTLVEGPLGRQRSDAILLAVRQLTDPAVDLQQLYEHIVRPPVPAPATETASPQHR